MHGAGPMLVLAGPGSGKTFVITRRILHLIKQHHVSPESILVITFTRAAALEMKARFLSLCDGEFLPVQFGTFHAVFFNILKEKFHYSASDILQKTEKLKILSDVVRLEQIKIPTRDEVLDHLLDEFSTMHNQGKNLSDFSSLILEHDVFCKLYHAYSQRNEMLGKLDFDNMVIQCHKLLNAEKDVLTKWQKTFSYILIDEFQDISPMQYDIVKKLAKPENNLFVVGDDDQSIYGFRGACPDMMFQFLKDFENCKQILLNINYRCSGNIVNAAGMVIEDNLNRFPKQIVPKNPKGAPVQLIRAFDKSMEYQKLADCLMEEKKKNNLMNCAIICRTSQDFAYISLFLKQKGIECFSRERKKRILKDEVFLDISAYLELIKGNMSRTYFFRVMNKPLRYIEREAVGEQVDLEQLYEHYGNKSYVQKNILILMNDLEKASKLSLTLAINYIRKKMGYDDYLKKVYQDDPAKQDEKLGICDMIQNMSKECKTIEEWKEIIKASEEYSDADHQNTKQLMLLTLHGSKGLEFDHVYLMDCNEKNIPHYKARTTQEIEEERRMFYVGMTRAKKLLYLFYVTGTKDHPIKVSRFLDKILQLH